MLYVAQWRPIIMGWVCMYWSRLFLQEGSGGPPEWQLGSSEPTIPQHCCFFSDLGCHNSHFGSFDKVSRSEDTDVGPHWGTQPVSCTAFTDTWRYRPDKASQESTSCIQLVSRSPSGKTSASGLNSRWAPSGVIAQADCFVSLQLSAGWHPANAPCKDSIPVCTVRWSRRHCWHSSDRFLSVPVGADPMLQYPNTTCYLNVRPHRSGLNTWWSCDLLARLAVGWREFVVFHQKI